MSRMNRWNVAGVVVFAGMCGLSGVASAQPVLAQRCAVENLNAAQAEARIEWARSCALTKVSPGGGWDTGAPSGNGGNLVDYTEPSPDPFSGQNSYMGAADQDINNSYINHLYRSGMTSQFIDARGYYKWTRPVERKKPRPIYPTYGNKADINSSTQLFPHPSLSHCGFYYDRNGTQPANVSFYVNGFCESDGSQLLNGVPVTTSGNAGSTTTYALSVPAGASRVLFETSGGTGDVDIYVRYNAAPTLSAYDCRPYLGGNTEGCNMPSPAAGTWFVMLHGYAAYSGVTLKATIY